VTELKGCEDKAFELEAEWMRYVYSCTWIVLFSTDVQSNRCNRLGRRIEVLEAEAEELEAAKDVLEEELGRLRATSE
jgi:hypothetical protein